MRQHLHLLKIMRSDGKRNPFFKFCYTIVPHDTMIWLTCLNRLVEIYSTNRDTFAMIYYFCTTFTRQVHIFNQGMMSALQQTNECILMDKIDPKETNPAHFGPIRPAVHKIPFRFADIPYFDTMYMCDPVIGSYSTTVANCDSDQESWDAPLRRTNTISSKITTATQMPYNQSSQTDVCGIMNDVVTATFSRDPSKPMPQMKR